MYDNPFRFQSQPCPTCGRCPTCGAYRPALVPLYPWFTPTTDPNFGTSTITPPPAGAGADVRLDDSTPIHDSHGDDGRLLDPISYGC